MQLLVACSECQRQYNATDLPLGSRFHCHCGQVVEVQRPADREASVVRCSSCGAPREAAASSCTFCGADFTLHDQDLDSVCPECLARISRQAKHCHHCGIRIRAELVAGDVSPLECPDCQPEPPRRLVRRQSRGGGCRLLECPHCAGLWLDAAAFGEMTERAADRSLGDQEFGRLSGEGGSGTLPGEGVKQGSDKWRYRACPVCGEMMQRRNYGRKSGIIIDTCRQHGVWLDFDEFPAILQWIRSGGLSRANEQLEQQRKSDQQTRRLAKPTSISGPGDATLSWDEPAGARPGWGLLFEALAEFFT
ncbi:MAG: hypothetical protein GTO03_10910 [Planctomycetales bacterium]|nr:hypothetical protein [Planctomycetales bacterium]